MNIDDVKRNAFAMPLNSPALPPGPYRFVNREFLIVTCRTDIDALRAEEPGPLQVTESIVPDRRLEEDAGDPLDGAFLTKKTCLPYMQASGKSRANAQGDRGRRIYYRARRRRSRVAVRGFESNALTGHSLVVGHDWFMQYPARIKDGRYVGARAIAGLLRDRCSTPPQQK